MPAVLLMNRLNLSRRYGLINESCSHCGSTHHLIKECPQLHYKGRHQPRKQVTPRFKREPLPTLFKQKPLIVPESNPFEVSRRDLD
jgi:hypothetical protein